jgi:hypothetical protein
MPSTDRKLELKSKISVAQTASQVAVYAKGQTQSDKRSLILPAIPSHETCHELKYASRHKDAHDNGGTAPRILNLDCASRFVPFIREEKVPGTQYWYVCICTAKHNCQIQCLLFRTTW